MDVRVESPPPVQGSGNRPKEIYSRSLDRTLSVRDVRAEIGRGSRRRPNEATELRAFLESKRGMIRSHPHLTTAERTRALAKLDRMEARIEASAPENAADGDAGGGDADDDEPPLPGGIGFGVFYRSAYKVAFEAGTAAEYIIICPTHPGGNVHSWIYLTAMNRAAHCPEALVAYHGGGEFRFAVFDWARQDHWQTDLPHARLREYLHELVLDGMVRQVLHVVTFTYVFGEGRWRNEVHLLNPAQNTFDRIYEFEYEATLASQHEAWEGSWGPIIETFQNRYFGTEDFGFADFSVSTCLEGEWGPWERLSPADTFVAQDETGFRMLYLDPNHTFLAAA